MMASTLPGTKHRSAIAILAGLCVVWAAQLGVPAAVAEEGDIYRKSLQEFSLERQRQNEAIQVQIASLREEMARAPRDTRLPPGSSSASREQDIRSKLRDLDLQLARVRAQLSDTLAAYEEQKIHIQELAAELSRAKGDVAPEAYQRAVDALGAGDTNQAESLLQQILEKRREQAKGAAMAAYQLGRIKEVERLDFRSAADLYKEAQRYDPEQPTYLIATAKNAWFLGQYAEAERLFESAEQLPRIMPTELAQILIGLAEPYRERGAYGKAEAAIKKALSILGASDNAVLMATAYNRLGLSYWFQGRYAEADEALAKAVGTLAGREDKASLTARGGALNSRASVMTEAGDMRAAEALYVEALSIRTKLFPRGDQDPMAASYMNNLGLLYRRSRRFDEAHDLFRKSRAMFERAYGPHHPRTATTIANQAATFCLEGEVDKAWPAATRALETRERLFGSASPVVGESIVLVGYLQRKRNDLQGAEESYRRALEIRKKLPKTAYLDYAKTLTMLGNLYVAAGRSNDAIAALREAVEVADRLELPSSPFVMSAFKHIFVSYAAALTAGGRLADAQGIERRAEAIAAGPVMDCAH